MNRKFPFFALAAVLAVVLSTASQGAPLPILVVTDAGGGSSDVTGTATGATYTTDSYTDDAITSINLVPISPTLKLVDYGTLTGSGVSITGTGTKIIGGVTLNYTITDGFAIGSHLNLDGVITSVIDPAADPGYNFSNMLGALVSISFDKTGANFANIVGVAGASVLAAGTGIEEAATVPEPTSVALLGIGMTGFLAFRRLFKRTSVA